MEFELLHVSVVVTAASHNPSILHPSFLRAENIVPPDWETAEAPVSTPAVAAVKYQNGVTFAVEAAKLQIVDNQPSGSSPLPNLVERYVRTLPKTPYTGVGINPTAFIETEKGGEYLIQRFLKAGPWTQPSRRLEAAAVRFVYTALGSKLRLSITSGSIRSSREESPERNGIILEGNYHQDVAGEDPPGEVVKIVSRFPEFMENFLITSNDVVLSRTNGD